MFEEKPGVVVRHQDAVDPAKRHAVDHQVRIVPPRALGVPHPYRVLLLHVDHQLLVNPVLLPQSPS